MDKVELKNTYKVTCFHCGTFKYFEDKKDIPEIINCPTCNATFEIQPLDKWIELSERVPTVEEVGHRVLVYRISDEKLYTMDTMMYCQRTEEYNNDRFWFNQKIDLPSGKG